jgi:hypothetical protein
LLWVRKTALDKLNPPTSNDESGVNMTLHMRITEVVPPVQSNALTKLR